MNIKNKSYVCWITFLVLFTISCFVLGTCSGQQFPVAPLGMCYDGVHTLGQMYDGHQIQYAYDAPSGNDQGHVWCIIDGQPIDSYYGPVSGNYWTQPQFVYNSLTELDQGIAYQTGYYEDNNGNWIKRCPVTGMTEEDKRLI